MANLKELVVGQPLGQFPGGTFNELVRGERARRQEQGTQPASPVSPMGALPPVAYVQLLWQGSEDYLPPGASVVLGEVMQLPENDSSVPYCGLKFRCTVATTETAENDFFAITATPIAPGSIGYGYIPNACWAQVNVTDEAHETSALADGETLLQSAESGRVPIIWKPTGTGTNWCVVALSSSGGGGAEVSVNFTLYKVTGEVGKKTIVGSLVSLGSGTGQELSQNTEELGEWTIDGDDHTLLSFSSSPVLEGKIVGVIKIGSGDTLTRIIVAEDCG